MYESDKPIIDSSHDSLNRHTFSIELAKTIINLDTIDTFTIGLYGRWGSGKTSIINLTLQEISKLSDSMPENERTVIVQFNPWNYSDTSQLIQQFFCLLSSELQIQIKDSSLSTIGNCIEEYADALEFTSGIPIVGKYAKLFQLLGKISGKTIGHIGKNKKQSISQIKNKIIGELSKQKRKILIVIDDIDRLSNNQIQMVFQLVNAVASFPNIIYLLSFDYSVVTRALADVQKCNGEEYLEKIIQIPFEIPVASKEKLNQNFFEKLDDILSKCSSQVNSFEREHWNSIFWNIINPCINSIRDSKRLLNSFQIKFGITVTELAWTDLLAITTLQVFYPAIYNWILKSNDVILNGANPYKGISGVEQKENHSKYIKIFDIISPGKSEYMLDCISTLFPQFGWLVGSNYENNDSDFLRTNNRVASKEKFNYYFNLSISEIPVRADTLNSILYTADFEMIKSYIELFVLNGKLIDFLTELRGKEKQIGQDRLQIIARALMQTYGESREESIHSLINQSSDNLIEYCVEKFLSRMNEIDCRFSTFKFGIENMSKNNLPGIATLINREELYHARLAGKTIDEKSQLLSLDYLLQLEKIYVQRISEIVKTESLLTIDCFFKAAYLWECFDPSGFARYISDELNYSDVNKCLYLAGYASEWKTISGHGGIGWSFSPSSFAKYLPTEVAIDAIEHCRNTETFISLKQPIKEKLAAFVLYMSPCIKEKDSISQEKAQKLIELWEKGKSIETIVWDELD